MERLEDEGKTAMLVTYDGDLIGVIANADTGKEGSSFSNTFSNVKPTTAESWLEAFAVWWNRCQS